MLGFFVAATPMYAAVIEGTTGSAYQSDGGGQFYFHLGTGLSGNLKRAYVTINDNSQAGFITNVILFECNTSAYNSPGFNCGSAAYYPTDGATTNYKTVALTGSSKRIISFDWSCHGFVSGAGTCTPGYVVLNPAKYYLLYFQASQNAQSPFGSTRSVYAYGAGVLLTDASGNTIDCGTTHTAHDTCGTNLGTPFQILTDAALSSDSLDAYAGGPVPSNWLLPTPASAGVGLTTTASVSESTFGKFGDFLTDIAFYIFSPWDETTAAAWVNFRNSFGVHIPFSYVTEVNTMVQTATYASGSMPAMTVYTSITGTLSFFDPGALTTGSWASFIASLRAIAVVAIWMSVLWYLYQSVKHLFG